MMCNGTMPMHMSMLMYFQWQTTGITLLFEGWKIEEEYQFWLSCLFFIALGIFYEYLSLFRAQRYPERATHDAKHKADAISSDDHTPLIDSTINEETELVANASHSHPHHHPMHHTWWFKAYIRFESSIFFIIQLVISYTLMLVIMTFNVGLCLACFTGYFVGHLLFGTEKPATCH